MAELCMMFPDGSIANVEHVETKYKEDKQIFRDIKELMQHSQIGICASSEGSTNFVPISQMMLYDEKPRDIGKEVVALGKKVKALERGRY